MEHLVYLDNAATTPLDPRVLDAMLSHLRGPRGNPSSLHASGTAARRPSRERARRWPGWSGLRQGDPLHRRRHRVRQPGDPGAGRAAPPEKRHVVVSRVEHAAVREATRRLEAEGFEVTRVEVDSDGLVDPAEFEDALRPDTALAAVVWANNEVGTVEPIEVLAGICAEEGSRCTATRSRRQDGCRLRLRRSPSRRSPSRRTSSTARRGWGALYVRDGVALDPIVYGGGQERGLRSGTENVAGVIGLGEAARLAREELEERVRHETGLRDRIVAGATEIPGVRLNGHPTERLSNNVHLTVEGVEAEGLVLFLDSLGYAVGSGSACGSAGTKRHRCCSRWAGTSGRPSLRSGSPSARRTPSRRSKASSRPSRRPSPASRELSPLYTQAEG